MKAASPTNKVVSTISTHDNWKQWPLNKLPEGHFDYERHPQVNTARVRSKITEQYMVHYENRDAIFVKIRDDDHSEYKFTETRPPKHLTGYEEDWMITVEEPPRWEFIGHRSQAPIR